MKLLLDENLSPRQALRLRDLGHDAVAVIEAGLAGQPDEVVRAFAIETRRILLTLDADFANILRYPPAGTPGVIWFKIHPPTEAAIARQITAVLERVKETDLTGRWRFPTAA